MLKLLGWYKILYTILFWNSLSYCIHFKNWLEKSYFMVTIMIEYKMSDQYCRVFILEKIAVKNMQWIAHSNDTIGASTCQQWFAKIFKRVLNLKTVWKTFKLVNKLKINSNVYKPEGKRTKNVGDSFLPYKLS